MKQTNKTLILLTLIFLAIIIFSFASCENKKEPVNVEYYKAGDILYPSYACPDTLIVVNAIGLNKGMGLIEQGIIDATDWDIDSVLHSNCKLY